MAVEEERRGGIVINIQRYSIHDGPGIRTLVFLKGCPLRCQWCSNPESMHPRPELAFRRSLCYGCGHCVPACPREAISLDLEGVRIDYERCDHCGACVAACPPEALRLYGQVMTAAQVFEQVRRDQLFYCRSGGGVTLTGGEPLFQPQFAIAILELCREAGIHTAVETSGYVSSDILLHVLEYVDHVMFDLKLIDESLHLRMTGQSHDIILRNARLVMQSGISCQPRMPLIPTVNDSVEEIQAIARFLKEVHLPKLELMPYHSLGVGKYESLGRQYPFPSLASVKIEEAARVKDAFEELGIECRISI